MALLDSLIGPGQSTPASAPAEQPSPTPAHDSLDVSEEQLTALPPVAAVIQGKPAGVSFPDKVPAAAIMVANLPKLNQLGLNLYRSASMGFVLFNEKLLPPEQVKTLDQQGKLNSVISPAQSISAPAPAADATATPEGAPAPAAAPAQPPVGPVPPRVQSKLAGTRLQALMAQNKAPTERPVPAGGQVLNSLLARAV